MPDYADIDPQLLKQLGTICLALPEAWTEPAWTGHRFLVRNHNFVHIYALTNEHGAVDTMLSFRSSEEERDLLIASGHPFFRPGWGSNTLGMVLTDSVDWDEVQELMTESYCLYAPKKLVALVDRPELPD